MCVMHTLRLWTATTSYAPGPCAPVVNLLATSKHCWTVPGTFLSYETSLQQKFDATCALLFLRCSLCKIEAYTQDALTAAEELKRLG